MIRNLIFSLMLLPQAIFAETITVFAASSLQDALNKIAETWEAETGHEVRISYAGSGTLARQIEEGAPADIFFSANAAWMDYLADKDAIDPKSRQDIIGNQLAIIANENVPKADFPSDEFYESRIAIGNIETVPSGIYGAQALKMMGLWDGVEKNLIQTESARMTLSLVASGEVDYGITFASDVVAEPRVYVQAYFRDLDEAIVYPAAITRQSQNAEIAEGFLTYLGSETAIATFVDYGFKELEAAQ